MTSGLVFDHYPFKLDSRPHGWETVSVGQIARLVASGFPSGEHNQDKKGVPHIRPMNVDREGRLDLTILKYVEGDIPRELQNGDVLFNNTNSPELIGKTAAVLIDARLAYSNHMTRIRLEDGLSPAFVSRQLHFLWMSGYFRHRCVNHVNQASISAEPLSETVPVLVAPSLEQFRIAGALDELFSDLDAGVAALERAREKLRLYRASVLKTAVEGALTAEWRAQHPHTEPANKLLERILAKRPRRWEGDQLSKSKAKGQEPPKNWKARYNEPLAPDPTDLPALPDGWCWAILDQVLWQLRSGTSETSQRERTDYPVLKSRAVRHGVIDFDDLNYVLGSQSLRFETFLQRGDFLITRLSGSLSYVGCSAVVSDIACEHIQYPDRIFCGKLVDGIDGRYLSYCFRHSRIRKRLEEAAKSTAGHQRISISDLVSLPLPVPPLAEQQAIVDAVEEQLSVIGHLEAELGVKLKSAQSLRQAILRHAFSGQLVPQDPSDEPASELLKRISAERETRTREAAVASRSAKAKNTARRGGSGRLRNKDH